MSNVYRKSQKQRARKFDRISWNSKRQSPCEINCDLVLEIKMTPQFGYWNIQGVVNIIRIFGIKSTDIYFFQLGQSCRMLLHYNDTKYDNIVYHSGSTKWRVAKKIMFGT